VPGHYLEQKQPAARKRTGGDMNTEEKHHAKPDALQNA
jgi:hypothetical protein